MNMMGGRVVPEYDPSITHCGYCGSKLVWGNSSLGKTFGCPNYGKSSDVDYEAIGKRTIALMSDKPWEQAFKGMGWHFHWWEWPPNISGDSLTG